MYEKIKPWFIFFSYSCTMQVRYFYYRWVVCYTCKTLFILYLQTHIARNFLCQNHKKNFQFSITPLRSVYQSTIYTGYMWIMCAIFLIFVSMMFWNFSEKVIHKSTTFSSSLEHEFDNWTVLKNRETFCLNLRWQ